MDHALIRKVRLFDDIDALSHAAALKLVESIANSSVPTFSIALSGGSTPERLYRLLAGDYAREIPWHRVHLFWGDERFVPPDDPASNYRMVRHALLDSITIPPKNVHPINTETDDAATSAALYARTLREQFGDDLPRFDLNILGMGDDGHTASLFPGGAYLENNDDSLVTVTQAPVAPHTRISLTMPVLCNARTTIFLVAGQKKHPVLKEILDDPNGSHGRYPAAMVEPRGDGELLWMVDQSAMMG